MLSVYYGDTKNEVNPDNWFKNVFDKRLLMEGFSKNIIESTSDCKVIGSECLLSDILGAIPPERIGSGVKAILYLMYEEGYEKYGIINSRWFGDNMIPYLKYVASIKDIRINAKRHFPFYLAEGDYKGYVEVINTGKKVYTDLDLHDEFSHIEAIENGWEV